jgi:hypothetical protein
MQIDLSVDIRSKTAPNNSFNRSANSIAFIRKTCR